jgi:hypothetical protein
MSDKHIVIELDDDGFVIGVYCPDKTYIVDLLDRADMKRSNTREVERYYEDVEKSLDNLHNCY